MKRNKPQRGDRRQVIVYGHFEPLWMRYAKCECGPCKDGVGFEFGNEGGWVIPLAELRKIVREQEELRKRLHL